MGIKNAPQVGTQKQRADLPATIRSDGGAIVRIYCGRRLIQSGKQICADVTNGCAGSLHTVQHIGDMETVKLAKPFSNGSNGNFLAADANTGLRRAKCVVQQLDDGFDGCFPVLGNQNFVVQIFIELLSAIKSVVSIRRRLRRIDILATTQGRNSNFKLA